MLSLIVNLGFQPKDLIFLLFKNMNGLSPIQPLLPPEKETFGLTCS